MNSSISSSEQNDWTAYIRRVLYVFAGFCGLFAVINLVVDPAHLYSDHAYERRVAELLLQGKAIANLRNYDERLVQRYYVQGLREAPEVAILGSSRAMQVRGESFSGRRVFNHSVSGASLPDYLAIWQLYRERSLRPGRLVLAVDPWVFNRNNDQVRWRSLGPEFADICRTLGIDAELQKGASAAQERVRTLFSLPYLVDSLRAGLLQRTGSEGTDFFVTEDLEHPAGARLPDGSVVSPAGRRAPDTALVDADAAGYAQHGKVYSLEGFHRLDPALRNAFERFLDLLDAEGVEVVMILPPYHRLAYQGLLREGYEMVTAAESYLHELGAQRGLVVLGSYNPLKALCTNFEFTDGMHPKSVCLSRMLNRNKE